MASYISEDEVFGVKAKPAGANYISDDEVFGRPSSGKGIDTVDNPLNVKEKKEGSRSFLGASAEAGGRAVLAGGATILDTLNPFTLSEGDAAILAKDNPNLLKQLTEKSASMALSRFANEQTKRASEVMKEVSPEERGAISKRSFNELEYGTLSPDKAAYLSPTRVAGDVLNALPTTIMLAVTAFFTRGRSLMAAAEAETAALASGATVEAAKIAARNASIKAGAETMAKVGAAGEGTVGYATQKNQTFEEAMAVPQDTLDTSPYYKDLIKQGYTPESARLALANSAAQESGLVGGAVDAGTNLALGGILGKVIGEGGKLIPRVAKGFAGEAATEAVQSAGEQAGANLAMQQLEPQREALAGVGEAAAAGLVVGGVMGGATAGAFGGKPTLTPEQQIAQQINANVQNSQPNGVNEAAIRALNPQTYDQTIVSPQQTVNRNTQIDALAQAGSVDDAVTAAMNLAGTIEGSTSYAAPTAPAAATPLVSPTPTFGGLPITPPVTSALPAAEPAATIAPETTAVTPTETSSELPTLAPRPQRIQGKTVADLSDDDLRAVVNDQSAPAITRRGAQIELDARGKEVAATVAPSVGAGSQAVLSTTPQVAPEVAPEVAPTTPIEANRGTNESFIDIPLNSRSEALPNSDSAPVGGVAAADEARRIAQADIDQWAAAENITDPPVLNKAPPQEDAAVNQIANLLNSQFRGKIYAYHDSNPVSVNGFALAGTAFVNTASPQNNIAKNSLHELKHTIEQIAEAERRQGLTNTPAQQFTSSIESIFSDIKEDGKRSYVEKFLHRDELNAITDPVAREERLQQLLQEPLLVSEMTADFVGNRATDEAFWRDVEANDPEGFKGFADKWMKIINNLLATLRGSSTQARGESAKVDSYIRDLNKAKMILREALIAYRRNTSQQTQAEAGKPAMSSREGENNEQNIPGRSEGVQPPTERTGPATNETGRSEIPSYGKARDGAISVVGRHYSPRVQTRLSGAYYGTGIYGAERNRIKESKDRRLSDRIYFYVDTGNGIRPESGVGRFAHEVNLTNIYDPASRLIAPQGNADAFESAVIDAGFDGYIAPFGRGAAVVLLGPKHRDVPVKAVETPAFAKKQAVAEETTETEKTIEPEKDLGNFRSVADDLGLSEAEYKATALGLMTGKTKSEAFETPRVGGIPPVVEWLDKRYYAAGMSALDLNKPEDRTTVAKMLAAEAIAAIKSAGNAVEWYDETVKKTLSIMAVKYPELNTDQNARNAFLMATAISSQKMNVEDNLRYASNQYDAFRKTGKFPETGTGEAAGAMANNFALANALLQDMGPDLLRRFLQTEVTKRELESMGFTITGESMDEKMLGSAVFGPKIGFGFYSNLSGNFEPVTMDMWFMRTVGRLTGKLPSFDEELFAKQVSNLRAALAETGDSSKGLYAADLDQALIDKAMKSDEGAIALARAINKLHNRQFKYERAAFDAGVRKKTALVGAAGTILKSADKPKDSPGSGGERQRLREVVRQMVKLVEDQTGQRVPPAALQALIWYPEQELYKKLGVKLRVTSQDYAGAAKSLLTKEGFDGKRISAAAQSGSGSARPVAGKTVAGTNQTVSTTGKSVGPLQGKERTAFIETRVERNLVTEANAVPLEDLFTKLNKKGIAKTNAEKIVNRREDSAKIMYVQENFLDILSELEDSGKVKINCD
jgi:hypothetical protein